MYCAFPRWHTNTGSFGHDNILLNSCKAAPVRKRPSRQRSAYDLTVPFVLLRSEIPSGMCAKLRTVAASNNRVHMPWSLYYCLFAPRVCMVLFFTHIPFVVNYTFNATPPERLQQYALLRVVAVYMHALEIQVSPAWWPIELHKRSFFAKGTVLRTVVHLHLLCKQKTFSYWKKQDTFLKSWSWVTDENILSPKAGPATIGSYWTQEMHCECHVGCNPRWDHLIAEKQAQGSHWFSVMEGRMKFTSN